MSQHVVLCDYTMRGGDYEIYGPYRSDAKAEEIADKIRAEVGDDNNETRISAFPLMNIRDFLEAP